MQTRNDPTTTLPVREGHVSAPGGRVWYRVVGDGDGVPLLVVHGGPGLGHDYLTPLAALAANQPVVFFDQLGCGKSERPADASLWRMERFAQELAAVREALGLDRAHLFGHSWGGWLAIEYMLGKPSGIVSLVLASTCASVPQFAGETARLRATLPHATRDTLNRCETAGDTRSSEYQEAMSAFYTRFVCRLDPWPEPLLRALQNFMDNPVPFATMIGPNVLTIDGNLRDWDRTNRLGEIGVPTLISCGRHDEMGPACAETLHRGIGNSELRIFEHSAHVPHLEEPERFLQRLQSFLDATTTTGLSRPTGKPSPTI